MKNLTTDYGNRRLHDYTDFKKDTVVSFPENNLCNLCNLWSILYQS
jgi:hypothetical protein